MAPFTKMENPDGKKAGGDDDFFLGHIELDCCGSCGKKPSRMLE